MLEVESAKEVSMSRKQNGASWKRMALSVAVSLHLGLAAECAMATTADVEDFPSADSIAINDGFGFYWSMIRGDSIQETFATAFADATRAVFDLAVPTNFLNGGAQVDWRVRLNGTQIGTFSVVQGQTSAHLDFSFAAIAGPDFTVRFEVTNEVPGGFGSHDFNTSTSTVRLEGTVAASPIKCYKVKDALEKAKYTADLTGLTAEPGCTISAGAKLLCVGTDQSNVTPAAPGGGPVLAAASGKFACYKVKCPKGTDTSVSVGDQFGVRNVTAKIGGKLFCVPAD